MTRIKANVTLSAAKGLNHPGNSQAEILRFAQNDKRTFSAACYK
jgi:hypothetical protein